MRGRRGLKGGRGPGPPSRPVSRLRGVLLRLRGGGAESDGGGGGGGLGGHRWRVRIARDGGNDVVGGRPEDESPLRHPSDMGATLPGPSGMKAAGLRGQRRWGRPAPATPPASSARRSKPRAVSRRPPLVAGNRGSLGWDVGMWSRKASGFREPHREVDSQLCESASLRGRLALARVTPPRCTPVTRQAGGRALLDKPAPANFLVTNFVGVAGQMPISPYICFGFGFA